MREQERVKSGSFGRALLAVLALAVVPVPSFAGSAVDLDRFAGEIAVFSKQDGAAHAEPGGTLFVGSSSIRLWDVRHGFPKSNVVNRGFGGATTPEVLHFYDHVVAPYRPASIIVYVGENDIAAGTAPETVADDVLALLDRIRHDNPTARIAYLSIKPSPARWKFWPRMIATNALLRARAGPRSFDFLDSGADLLTKDGTPAGTLYRRDGLHLSEGGYAIWQQMIDDYLAKPGAPRTPARTPAPGPATTANRATR